MRSVLRRNIDETVVWSDRVKLIQCAIFATQHEMAYMAEEVFVGELAHKIAAEIAAKLLEHKKYAKVDVSDGSKFVMRIEVIVPTADDVRDLLRAETYNARREAHVRSSRI
jgi:hypothetical protein